MGTSGDQTREHLLDVAERLYGDLGVGNVSLRQIRLAAKQGNTAAVQYHFGDRDGVVRAIAERHMPRLLAIQHYFSEDQVAYYEPGNVDDLAATIRRFYKNPAERYSLAVKSSAFAQNFHWNMLKNVLFDVEDGNLPARPFPASSPAAMAATEEK